MFKSLFESVSAVASVGTESESLGHFHILFHFIDNMILYNLLWLLYLGRHRLDLLECVWLRSYLNLGGIGIGHIVWEFPGNRRTPIKIIRWLSLWKILVTTFPGWVEKFFKVLILQILIMTVSQTRNSSVVNILIIHFYIGLDVFVMHSSLMLCH